MHNALLVKRSRVTFTYFFLGLFRFLHVDGDHLTLLNVFNAFQQNSEESQVECQFQNILLLSVVLYDNFLDFKQLMDAAKIRHQISLIVDRYLNY